MRKRIRVWVIGLTICFLLAAVWGVLATPQTASGAKPVREKATYTITFFGDLDGFDPDPATGTTTMRIQDDALAHMWLNDDSTENPRPIDLNAFFAANLDEDPGLTGQDEADQYVPIALGTGIHGIEPIKKNPANGVTVTIFFDGLNKDGVAMRYRLDMEGYVDPETVEDIQTWANPGGVGDSISPSVVFTKWSVKSDTKGGRGKSLQLEDQPFDSMTGIEVTGLRVQ